MSDHDIDFKMIIDRLVELLQELHDGGACTSCLSRALLTLVLASGETADALTGISYEGRSILRQALAEN